VFLAISLAVVVGLYLFFAVQTMNEWNSRKKTASEIVKGVAELRIITDEYLLHPEKRSITQLQSRYSSLVRIIKRVEFKRLRQKAILNEIFENISLYEPTFQKLLKIYSSGQEFAKPIDDIRLNLANRLKGELLVKSQSIITSAFLLQQAIHADLLANQKKIGLWAAGILLILSCFNAAIVLWINKSIGTSIEKLKNGVEIIGSGNLNHRVGTVATDEIGELSRTFDKMAENLSKTTASIDRLNKEVEERQKAERELRESESRFRLLYEEAPLGYQSLDEKGHLLLVNQKWLDTLGYEREEVIGKSFGDFLHPDWVDHFKENFPRFKAAGEILSVEFEMVKKDGSLILAAFHGKIRSDPKGRFIQTHCVFQDITEQRKAEKDKTRLEDQLRQSQKMEAIGSLAGGIAHEFNNILGAIIGNTELAINDVPDRNPAKDCLKEIQRASLRAKDVVGQILGFARKSVFQLQPVQISPIINESLKLIRASIPATIEIRRNLSCKSDTVMADSSQINLVLLNLCANAKNAMQEEGGVLEVKLENTSLDETSASRYEDLSPGNYVKLTVRDSGHGIDPKIIDRIFEPYFTTTSLAEGTGMGLAVVHGIVKHHNGAITVASEPGKGTVFEVLFPLTEAEAEQEAGEPEALPTGNEKILFVDDEASLVKMAKRSLEMQGYRVEAKSNPVEALELVRSEPDRFDLIITDMTMPNMTGDKLAIEILSIRPDMPIILCSGFSKKIDAEKAAALGIRKYIEKPLDMSDFVGSIRKVLDEARASAQQ